MSLRHAVDALPRPAWYIDPIPACSSDSALEGASKVGTGPSPSPSPNPSEELTGTIHVSAARSDTFVGPYQLLRKLGEGGMGVVYHARQFQPIRRDVALKIIKPGMDS